MEFTQEVRKATDPIYQKISKVMPEIEWSVHAPYIHKINKLKKEKNAVILAHNYQTPEIYHDKFLVFDNCELKLQHFFLFLIY